MAQLLSDIEAFLSAYPEISATSLGDGALGDRHLVRQLRRGRRVWPETEAKVRRFMADHATSATILKSAMEGGKVNKVSAAETVGAR